MVNLIIGVSRVRANSTNTVHAISDTRKGFRGENERRGSGRGTNKR